MSSSGNESGRDVFEAISHPVRREVLSLLTEEPKSFSELMDETGLESSTLAFHLRKLDGLVEKDSQGLYRLTEFGAEAWGIASKLSEMGEIEGRKKGGGNPDPTPQSAPKPSPPDAGPPSSPQASREIEVIEGRVFLRLDRGTLERLRNEGGRLVVQDVVFLEVDEDVDEALLRDTVERVQDVVALISPKGLDGVLTTKSRNVVISGEMASSLYKGALSKLRALGMEGLLRSVPLVKIPPVKPAASEASLRGSTKEGKGGEKGEIDLPLERRNALRLEVNGGVVDIEAGEPHLKAWCDEDEVEVIASGDQVRVEVEGCMAMLTYPANSRIEAEVNGGSVRLTNSRLQALATEVNGGSVELNLADLDGNVEVEVNGGVVKGKLGYSPIKEKRRLRVEVTGGVLELDLDVPEGVGVETGVETEIGGIALLPSRRNAREGAGTLEIYGDVEGGSVRISEVQGPSLGRSV
jgi:DNA-binding transcriptional ArsR family regulator